MGISFRMITIMWQTQAKFLFNLLIGKNEETKLGVNPPKLFIFNNFLLKISGFGEK